MNLLARREPRNVFATPGLINRLFNDPFFTNDFVGGQELASEMEDVALPLDISEDEKALIVRGSLPGFKKEDVEVEVHEGVLTIKATHTEQAEETKENYLRRERRTRSVQRRVGLPSSVEGALVDAELKDGVLTLRLPKAPEAQPKKIAIR